MEAVTGSGTRVLVVGDDEDVRTAIVDRLRNSGFAVFQAADGFHALTAMRARHFHVVITDCTMPGLGGLDFLRECRRNWPSTPVILLSAASTQTEELSSSIGAFAALQKPFDADHLLALVCRAAGLPPPCASPPGSGIKAMC